MLCLAQNTYPQESEDCRGTNLAPLIIALFLIADVKSELANDYINALMNYFLHSNYGQHHLHVELQKEAGQAWNSSWWCVVCHGRDQHFSNTLI